MKGAIVFLGPSLDLGDAKKVFPGAVYRPPIALGDLVSFARDLEDNRPWGVGIIDGYFYQKLPVWHKEILFVLSKGIEVFGASSMGALRAVECAPFGMIGVGEVFRRFQSGELIGDDEVALAHGGPDEAWKGYSLPLVNVRVTLEEAWKSGIISQEIGERVIGVAKDLWFPERSLAGIMQAASNCGIAEKDVESVRAIFDHGYVDVKRLDALELLRRMRDREKELSTAAGTRENGAFCGKVELEPGNGNWEHRSSWGAKTSMWEPSGSKWLEGSRCHLFDAMVEREKRVSRRGRSVSQEEIARCVGVASPKFAETRDRALDRYLLGRLADEWNVQVTAEEVEGEVKRFCARGRIGSEEELDSWRAENDLSKEEFEKWMKEQARIRKLRNWAQMDLNKRSIVEVLMKELKYTREYPAWVERAAVLKTIVPDEEREENDGDSPAQLRDLILDQMRSGGLRPDIPLDEFAREAGFLELEDFLGEVRRHVALRRIPKRVLGSE